MIRSFRCRLTWTAAVIAGILAAGLLAPAAARAEAGPPVKMGTLAPEGSAWHLILKDMREKWRTAPGGGVTLKIYPGGILGDETDMIRKMRVGHIQAGVFTVAGLGTIDRSVFALAIPMMYRDYAELDYVQQRMRPTLEARLLEKGFVVLSWGDAGWIRFFGKEPILTPDDLKRMKFFVWAGDADAVDLWKAAGFNPIPLSATDILPGLQTGLINAFDATAISALSFQWFPLAPHMTDLAWAPLTGATIMTREAWERIPAEAQPALRAAAEEAGARMRQEIRADDEKSIEVMKTKGLTVHTITTAERASWQQLFEDAYPRMVGRIVTPEAFQEAMRYRDEYRAHQGGGAPGPARAGAPAR